MASGKEFVNPMDEVNNQAALYPKAPPSYEASEGQEAITLQPQPGQQIQGPQTISTVHVAAAAPPSVHIVGNPTADCPICRVGKLKRHYPCCAICCCIMLFPIGIICCCCMRKKKCGSCGYTI